MRRATHTFSLRSKIFFSFGLLLLLSVASIAIFASSLARSELDAYALQNIDRNIQYTTNEIEALFRNTRSQGTLFASDQTVRKALDGYEHKSALDKWESWSALQTTCNLWIATHQVDEIRVHFYKDMQFLRDGLRFISGVALPKSLKQSQGKAEVYWDFFSKQKKYSCFAPIVVGWQEIGYVEIQMLKQSMLKSIDTHLQTGTALYLTDGVTLLDAHGHTQAFTMGLELSKQSTNTPTHVHQMKNGVKMLYTIQKMSQAPLYLIGEMPAALLSEDGMNSLQSIVLLLFVVLLFAFLLAWLISRSICSRLEKLKTAMATVQSGQLNVQLKVTSRDELGQILKTFNHMAGNLKAITETALQNERIGKEAELRLMQAQMNPHFIYNTLESISWASAGHDTEHVQYLVRNLSDFLRATLSKTRQKATLSGELNAILSYWNIQTYRFGDKIELNLEANPDALNISMPPLLLQPLIENALLHGILPKATRSGHICLRAELAEDLLIVEVEDDGVGIEPEALNQLRHELDIQTDGNYGLWNVHQRVRTQYGQSYGLSVQSTPQEGTLCILTLPAKELSPNS